MSTPGNDVIRGQAGPAAVLWDFDGTLVDTEPVWLECQRELVAAYGGEYTEEVATQCVGQSMADSARLQIALTSQPDLDVDWWVRTLSGMVTERVAAQPIPWRPGAQALLAECRAEARRCAVVTASPPELVAAVFDRVPDHPFATIVDGYQVTRGKPDPQPYLMAAERLGVDPAQCLVFEDSNPGSQSGNSAGAVVIACPSLAPVSAAPRRIIIETLAGLTMADADRMWSSVAQS